MTMYRIVKVGSGEFVGATEAPCYIRKKAGTGCYVPADADAAQGIVFDDNVYNLVGTRGIGAAETVMLGEYDNGAEIEAINAAIDDIIVSILEG